MHGELETARARAAGDPRDVPRVDRMPADLDAHRRDTRAPDQLFKIIEPTSTSSSEEALRASTRDALFYTREMKTVLVTGASRGLGLELARQYVHKTKEGDASPTWRVVVCVRGDPSQELSDVLRQGHDGCTHCA